MPITLNHLELGFGPQQVGAPDAIDDPILRAIETTQGTIRVATQQLSYRKMVDALIAAAARGVSVAVILERDYLLDREPSTTPWVAGGWIERNREALAALFRARIPVRLDRVKRLLHNNFLVIDGQDPQKAIVISSSANLTENGFSLNLNHALYLQSHDAAVAFGREFSALWGDRIKSPHAATPVCTRVGGVRTKVLFGPDHGPEMEVMKQIAKAKHSIIFSMFTFARSSGIDDALALACRAGISVRGVLDGNQSNERWAATHGLKEAGIDLCVTRYDMDGKLHHKLMIVDEALVIIGTFNFTASAARFNEEALIVLGDLDDDPSPEEKTVARYAIQEADRIRTNLTEPR